MLFHFCSFFCGFVHRPSLPFPPPSTVMPDALCFCCCFRIATPQPWRSRSFFRKRFFIFTFLLWGAALCDSGPPHIDDARPPVLFFHSVPPIRVRSLFFSLLLRDVTTRIASVSQPSPSPSVLLSLVHAMVNTSEYSGFNQRYMSVYVVVRVCMRVSACD